MELSAPSTEAREFERAKYVHCYVQKTYNYAMGPTRMIDAREDLVWALERGAGSYLDIGCGRGEMLDYATEIGFHTASGAEVVPGLCEREGVSLMFVHDLHRCPDAAYSMVTSFDVIEHLLPDDDQLLVTQMGRIARDCIALTANNKDSIDPTTKTQLHVNKRPYDEWDKLIRAWLSEWTVERMTNKQYVSETWRAWR